MKYIIPITVAYYCDPFQYCYPLDPKVPDPPYCTKKVWGNGLFELEQTVPDWEQNFKYKRWPPGTEVTLAWLTADTIDVVFPNGVYVQRYPLSWLDIDKDQMLLLDMVMPTEDDHRQMDLHWAQKNA